jgi:hypothetical protein
MKLSIRMIISTIIDTVLYSLIIKLCLVKFIGTIVLGKMSTFGSSRETTTITSSSSSGEVAR